MPIKSDSLMKLVALTRENKEVIPVLNEYIRKKYDVADVLTFISNDVAGIDSKDALYEQWAGWIEQGEFERFYTDLQATEEAAPEPEEEEDDDPLADLRHLSSVELEEDPDLVPETLLQDTDDAEESSAETEDEFDGLESIDEDDWTAADAADPVAEDPGAEIDPFAELDAEEAAAAEPEPEPDFTPAFPAESEPEPAPETEPEPVTDDGMTTPEAGAWEPDLPAVPDTTPSNLDTSAETGTTMSSSDSMQALEQAIRAIIREELAAMATPEPAEPAVSEDRLREMVREEVKSTLKSMLS